LLPSACRGQSQGLLPNEAHPDEVERSTHADQEADQGQKAGVEESVSCPANSAPEEKAGDHVAEDGPEGILFAAIIAGLVGHAAMVDEF
jgi:hypothetical protein